MGLTRPRNLIRFAQVIQFTERKKFTLPTETNNRTHGKSTFGEEIFTSNLLFRDEIHCQLRNYSHDDGEE